MVQVEYIVLLSAAHGRPDAWASCVSGAPWLCATMVVFVDPGLGLPSGGT